MNKKWIEHKFYVYIMASLSGTLYIGFTNSLYNRISQHKKGTVDGFTKKYKCHKLVYYEEYQYIADAIAREKQLKGWSRNKKQTLIKKLNPHWNDLSEDWYK